MLTIKKYKIVSAIGKKVLKLFIILQSIIPFFVLFLLVHI